LSGSSGSAGDRALDESELDADPIRQFQRWFDDAKAAGEPEPEAMALATAGSDGEPSNRFVLLKSLDQRGFVFYTNGRSRKGREIAANPRAALVFRWWRLQRQVRVSGPVAPVQPGESDAYFKTRPLGAQLGAWASAQSDPLASRAVLDQQVAAVAQRFAGREVPRPPWWGGFRVRPVEVEFWQGRPDRLHDRMCYRLVGGRWRVQRLSP
jgi:pyridoxamine 5'-phosphate oxidase